MGAYCSFPFEITGDRRRPVMHRTVEFLLHHGHTLLLAWVFAEQIGLPLPSMPLLLAAGALAGTGHLNLFVSLLCAVLAALAADSIWYYLGRRKGIRVLQLLCKISLEPDSCVRRTEGLFAKQGAHSLLLAKFLPGLGTVAPPLAGVFHMRARRFLLYDASATNSSPGAASFASCASLELPWTNSNKKSMQARNSSSSICGIPWISKRSLKLSPAHFEWMPRSWKRRVTACRAIAKSFSTVLDPTKPPAPVWRSSSEDMASSRSGRSRAASKPGASVAIRWTPNTLQS